MKHKYLLLSAVFALGAVSPLYAKDLPISAQINSEVRVDALESGPRNVDKMPETKRSLFQDIKQRLNLGSENKRSADRPQMEKESQADRVEKRTQHVIKVLTVTADRLDKITLRIESRIGKIHALNESTGQAEDFVAEAKASLAEARTHISLISSVDVSTASTTNKEILDNIKIEAKAAGTSLTEARRNLSKAIGEIKGLERNLSDNNEGSN